MKKLIQNRLHIPKKQRGNCMATVIACVLELNSPEDVPQVQEIMFDEDTGDSWVSVLSDWLNARGWEWGEMKGHLYDNSYYFVIGNTKRSKNVKHVCIYKNGELYHDPHPDQSGLINETSFEYIIKTSN